MWFMVGQFVFWFILAVGWMWAMVMFWAVETQTKPVPLNQLTLFHGLAIYLPMFVGGLNINGHMTEAWTLLGVVTFVHALYFLLAITEDEKMILGREA